MSRFLQTRLSSLAPYVPGEQPKANQYIKLNTNESPFPPSPRAVAAAAAAAKELQLYPDPTCTGLTAKMAALLGVAPENVLFGNGSDDILYLAFRAFGEKVAFPDITYGFYRVFADFCGIPALEIPLREDFTVNPRDYEGLGRTIFIANPNAPTGIALSRQAVEGILLANPENVVVVDEAYIDFGGESCLPLLQQYRNLLLVRTFSKSRSMAGARLGFAIGDRELIEDLQRVKYAINPYSVNGMTLAAGIGAVEDEAYTQACCREIRTIREDTRQGLLAMGFDCPPSDTNFLFARHPRMEGGSLYEALKARGILVRHFNARRIRDYNRISIGSRQQMETFLRVTAEILEENV